MKSITAFLLLASVAVSSAFLGFGKDKPLEWKTLRVTWGPVPIKGKFFDTMPLTVQDAKAAGWVSASDSCYNEQTKFSGYRYTLGNDDTSMNLIFNENGVIAGIQMNVPVSEITANGNDYQFDKVSMFTKNVMNGVEVYTLTAYFSAQENICNKNLAKTEADLKTNGLGSNLFFQDGESTFEVPKNKEVALKTGWNDNNCFPGMGWHTWYQSEKMAEANCTMDRPIFLLFNKNKELLGFGFNLIGTANSPSERYEHPPALAVKTIMGSSNTPQCLIDRQKSVGLTTMHVFFVDYTSIPFTDCVNPFNSK